MRDRSLAEVCADYYGRIRHHVPLDEIEVVQERDLGKRVPAGAYVVALDPAGREWSTREFAAFVEERMVRGTRTLAFAVGGALGLPEALAKNADLRLSLSRLTLPHRLARVVLAEQIYRALTIIRGEPYDH